MKWYFLSFLIVLCVLACTSVKDLQPQKNQASNEEISIEDPAFITKEMQEVEPDRRVWRAPDYISQKNILGYDSSTFSTPEPLKERVQFWVDIFTKYTTSQGILHDSRHVHIVYEEVDLSSLDKIVYPSYRQRYRAEQKIIDKQKEKIKDILTKLEGLKSSEGLEGEELRYWKMFESVDEENKFKEASKKGRLRFQLGQSDRFKQGIVYSGKYLKEMEEIFESHSLPKELTRLPFVESSFNIRARSKVGASGIWQFMRGTGREYMKVNNLIDERNDPIEATIAAAKKLKSNYRSLNNWPLAVTAYNYGVYGMKRIIEKHQSTDLFEYFGRQVTSRFGFATESFYASFLAAVEVEKNAKTYFGEIIWDEPFEYEKIILKKAIFVKDLKPLFKDNELASYNPHFSRQILTGQSLIPIKTQVKIPVGHSLASLDFL